MTIAASIIDVGVKSYR